MLLMLLLLLLERSRGVTRTIKPVNCVMAFRVHVSVLLLLMVSTLLLLLMTTSTTMGLTMLSAKPNPSVVDRCCRSVGWLVIIWGATRWKRINKVVELENVFFENFRWFEISCEKRVRFLRQISGSWGGQGFNFGKIFSFGSDKGRGIEGIPQDDGVECTLVFSI